MKPNKTLAFLYRHRLLIADGLVIAALVLRQWNKTHTINLPTAPPRRRCQPRIK